MDRWRTCRFRPGAPDIVFGLVLVSVLVQGRQLLCDPGTFWHVRLGREIARMRTVPHLDVLTYTRNNAYWVDQSWAFDLGLAGAVNCWGWSATIALAAIGLASLYAVLARGLIADGSPPAIALVVSLLAAWIGMIHFLIRPHLFTFVFVYWTLRACQAQHRRGGWAIASLPVVMVLWANLHGGFLAGPLIVATSAVGHAISSPWNRATGINLAKFTGVFLICVLAPLCNPYGVGLYQHVAQFISGAASLTNEFGPMPFGQGPAKVFEWVLLALIAIPALTTGRMDRYNLLHSLVWLHLALISVRHAPLFALAVAPGLAQLLKGIPLARTQAERTNSSWSIWPAVSGLAVLLAACLGVRLGGFDPTTWPLQALPALDRQPAQARLFHEMDWGGMIESECQPVRQAFIDDRCELFGKSGIEQYLNILQGGPDWDEVRDRERIQLVWIKPDRPLARRLKTDPAWRILYRDELSILFRHEVETRATAASGSGPDSGDCPKRIVPSNDTVKSQVSSPETRTPENQVRKRLGDV